ncbi:MAG: antitoxin family protein [Pirellulales bacterium]|nr:antitoxin family protein [Pirellulales bacterium]
MNTTIDAMYDGEVFRPEAPLDLQPNTRVRLTVESATASKGEPYSFLRTAQSLNLDGPPDWSKRLNDYLYGDAADA